MSLVRLSTLAKKSKASWDLLTARKVSIAASRKDGSWFSETALESDSGSLAKRRAVW